jgi:hypothetical protein
MSKSCPGMALFNDVGQFSGILHESHLELAYASPYICVYT